MNGDSFSGGMNNFGMYTSMVSYFQPDANTIISLFQDDASEEIPLARCPRRARLSKPLVSSSQPPNNVVQQSGPTVVEADVTTPAAANDAPVAASAGVKTTAPAEVTASAPIAVKVTAPETVPLAEPEVTVETPVHPQDVNLDIPPQKVSFLCNDSYFLLFQLCFSF